MLDRLTDYYGNMETHDTGSCSVVATDPTCTVLYTGAAAALDSHGCCGHATLLCAACMRTSLLCC